MEHKQSTNEQLNRAEKKYSDTNPKKMHLHWQLAFNNGNTAKQRTQIIIGIHEHDSEFILFLFLKYEIQMYTNAEWIAVRN